MRVKLLFVLCNQVNFYCTPTGNSKSEQQRAAEGWASMSWFSWNEPYNRSPRREPSEVVVDTLMLELSWQMKEAERLQRERDNEYRRLKSGVDYSWLVSAPRTSYNISQGERLGLEDLCNKIPPAYCGPAIQRWDRWVKRSILHLLFSTRGCSSLQVQGRLIWVISLLSRLCVVSTRKCTKTAMLFFYRWGK